MHLSSSDLVQGSIGLDRDSLVVKGLTFYILIDFDYIQVGDFIFRNVFHGMRLTLVQCMFLQDRPLSFDLKYSEGV